MGSYVNVTDSTFEQEVINSDVPVLVDFWAPWCGPCRAIAPHVEALAEQYKGQLKVAKVNVDDNQGTATRFGIRGIPTVLVFKGGKLANQMVGAPPDAKAKLTKLVQGVL
jgi:thioredoxin 1